MRLVNMADEADTANDLRQAAEESGIAAIRKNVASMPKGETGECDLCGEWSGRLVGGACAPCRDKYKLP